MLIPPHVCGAAEIAACAMRREAQAVRLIDMARDQNRLSHVHRDQRQSAVIRAEAIE